MTNNEVTPEELEVEMINFAKGTIDHIYSRIYNHNKHVEDIDMRTVLHNTLFHLKERLADLALEETEIR
ncbi:MAG: hypothetical protein JRJ00_14780 [Deltaproteobacteria bacterium]|nr:hypothetical protein [Deltaproteobacteria bacterium]